MSRRDSRRDAKTTPRLYILYLPVSLFSDLCSRLPSRPAHPRFARLSGNKTSTPASPAKWSSCASP